MVQKVKFRIDGLAEDRHPRAHEVGANHANRMGVLEWN